MRPGSSPAGAKPSSGKDSYVKSMENIAMLGETSSRPSTSPVTGRYGAVGGLRNKSTINRSGGGHPLRHDVHDLAIDLKAGTTSGFAEFGLVRRSQSACSVVSTEKLKFATAMSASSPRPRSLARPTGLPTSATSHASLVHRAELHLL